MLIVDGIKYKLWIPKDEEKDFHPMVKKYSKEIFNEDSIYFDIKHKLTSKSGIAAIPDAYVITLSKPYEWYIVENELASHQVYNHIVPQVSKFVDSIEELETQRDIRDILNNMVEQDKDIKAFIEKKTGKDSYRFLSELVSLSPKIALIIDEITPEVDKASKSLKKLANTKIIEFKTFVRDDASNVYAHLFEPIELESFMKETESPLHKRIPNIGLKNIIEKIISQINSITFTTIDVYNKFKELYPSEFEKFEKKYEGKKYSTKTLIAKNLKDYARAKDRKFVFIREIVNEGWGRGKISEFKKK